MELNLKRTPLASLSAALDAVSEQPVDIDFTLPDYCPDIEKLLRCKLTPKIYSRNLSGGQLQLEGNTVVSVLYADSENGRVRVAEQTVPFSAVFRLKETPEDYVMETGAKCEYVNCRALSRRRMTVHGAFSLCARLLKKEETDLFSPEDIENAEFLTRDVSLSSLSALGGAQFGVGDEVIVSGKPPVELVLDSDVNARITQTRTIPDKLMLSGDLCARLLYLSDADSPKPERLDYIIPFSEVIDCAGLSEDCTVCVNLDVMSYDVKLKNDILSEKPVVNVDARLSCTVSGYKQKEYTVALDAFGTENVCEPELTRVAAPKDTRKISETFMLKDALSLDDVKLSEIIDITAEKCPITVTAADNKLTLCSKLNICILAFNEDNEPIYLERSVEVNRETETDFRFNSVECSELSVVSLSFRLAENNALEIRCELNYSVLTSERQSLNIVSSLNCFDDRPAVKKQCALTLYYAEAGESLWEIAKLYGTPMSVIAFENSLDAERLPKSAMLLIPTV